MLRYRAQGHPHIRTTGSTRCNQKLLPRSADPMEVQTRLHATAKDPTNLRSAKERIQEETSQCGSIHVQRAFFVLFTTQATIVFLTTFSKVDVMYSRNSQTPKRPSRQYRADRVVRKIGMVASTLAIKRLVMELTQQVGTRSILYFKDVDSKPSLSCKKPISFHRWQRIRKTTAKRSQENVARLRG